MQALDKIPFSKAHVAPHQLEKVGAAFETGHTSGDGVFTEQASSILADLHRCESGPPTALLTTNCTAALELSAMLLELEPGDEVIVPSFTFVTTASAFALRGARLVFCDIDERTWGLDAEQVAAAITPRTRAIVAVHYGGVSAHIDRLVDLARANDLVLIEDNAHGLFGSDESGRSLGTRGALSTLSFHATKNISCGEGGALIINDPSLSDRAEILREKGTDRRRFLQGKVDKYRWIEVGSSLLPSDVLAAVLVAQLEFAATSQARRHEIWDSYDEQLRTTAAARGWSVFGSDSIGRHPAHLFALRLESADQRTRFLEHCRDGGVGATFHYGPLHSSPAGSIVGHAPLGCPVTDAVSSELIRLPLFFDLTEGDVERVVERVTSFAG